MAVFYRTAGSIRLLLIISGCRHAARDGVCHGEFNRRMVTWVGLGRATAGFLFFNTHFDHQGRNRGKKRCPCARPNR
jgi:hypothetical protein